MCKLKKVLAIVLSVVLSISCLPIFASAKKDTINDPVVYVRGDGGDLFNADGTKIERKVDKSKIVDMVKSVIFPYFVNCITSGTEDDWQAYYDKFEEVVSPIYADYRLDDNGEASDGSGIGDELARQNEYLSTTDNIMFGNEYNYGERLFSYDCRVDPFETAKGLNDFIQEVKKSTDHDKVGIWSACMGGSTVLAYLKMYGSDDISSIMFDSPTVLGSSMLIGMATGSLDLSGEQIQRYLEDMNFKNLGSGAKANSLDTTTVDFLAVTVELLNQYHIIDIANGGLKPFMKKLNKGLLPQLMMASYGSCPNYWAQIGNEYFDDAIENTFGVKDYKTRYAKLLEKIYRFHDEVSTKYEEILKDAMANGTEIGVIAKYGYAESPIFGDKSNELGDGKVACKYASFGATVAKADEKLSKSYIAKQTEKGLEKYISCDRAIDASTCLVPDKTWFIKGIYHESFGPTQTMTQSFFRSNGKMDINTYKQYPQYMIIDDRSTLTDKGMDNRIIPMTEENMNNTDWTTGEKKDYTSPKSFVDTLTSWIVSFIGFFKKMIVSLQNMLQNLVKKK